MAFTDQEDQGAGSLFASGARHKSNIANSVKLLRCAALAFELQRVRPIDVKRVIPNCEQSSFLLGVRSYKSRARNASAALES